MSNEKDETTCCLIVGLGKQLGANICRDRLALSKENLSSWRYICGRGHGWDGWEETGGVIWSA